MGECVLTLLELQHEEAQREHEELAVILVLEDRIPHIADKVLEEGSNHDIDRLTYFQVN